MSQRRNISSLKGRCSLNLQQYLSGQEHLSHFPAPKDALAMVGVFYSLLILLLGPF